MLLLCEYGLRELLTSGVGGLYVETAASAYEGKRSPAEGPEDDEPSSAMSEDSRSSGERLSSGYGLRDKEGARGTVSE